MMLPLASEPPPQYESEVVALFRRVSEQNPVADSEVDTGKEIYKGGGFC